MNDPIVDEVRQVREAYAAKFNFNVRAIFQDLKQRERERGLTFVDGVAHQHETNASQTSKDGSTRASTSGPCSHS